MPLKPSAALAAVILALTRAFVAAVGAWGAGVGRGGPEVSSEAIVVSTEELDTGSLLAATAFTLPARLPILMYHYVDDQPPPMGPYSDGLTVRTPDFRAQMDYLAENGYRTVLLTELLAAANGAGTLPSGKLVALTFDDGGLDNYSVAYPILREHGFVATFFVVTGKVGALNIMTWEQLKEMNAGGMSIQSHSRSHPDLAGLSPEALKAQLDDFRSDIESRIGAPVQVLCYPSGSYDQGVMEAARALGYGLAVTTKPGTQIDRGALLELPRVRIPAFMSIEDFGRAVGR